MGQYFFFSLEEEIFLAFPMVNDGRKLIQGTFCFLHMVIKNHVSEGERVHLESVFLDGSIFP